MIDARSTAGILVRELGRDAALEYARRIARTSSSPEIAADYAEAAVQIAREPQLMGSLPDSVERDMAMGSERLAGVRWTGD